MGLIKKETSFLNKLFDNLNTMFFKDMMPQVVITIQGERAGKVDTIIKSSKRLVKTTGF